MSNREALHTALVATFPDLNVYYNPKDIVQLQYPCIVYKLNVMDPTHSNNAVYVLGSVYQVSILSTSSDFADVEKIYGIKGVRHVNTFTASDITNYVFNIRVNTL